MERKAFNDAQIFIIYYDLLISGVNLLIWRD